MAGIPFQIKQVKYPKTNVMLSLSLLANTYRNDSCLRISNREIYYPIGK